MIAATVLSPVAIALIAGAVGLAVVGLIVFVAVVRALIRRTISMIKAFIFLVIFGLTICGLTAVAAFFLGMGMAG